jgi:UPF0716 protein FxsA
MWLFVLFVAVPLIEIALFIQVGGWIGLWPTLLIVVLTAVLGTALVRREGARALQDLRRALEGLRDPSTPLAHGAMILFAGALLLTPGFFTDAVGFLLLVPAVRAAALRQLAARVRVQSFRYGAAAPGGPARRPGSRETIEGEWEELPDEPPQAASPEDEPSAHGTPRPTHRPSGWTRH